MTARAALMTEAKTLPDDVLASRARERQQAANVAQRHAAARRREADGLRKEQRRRAREQGRVRA